MKDYSTLPTMMQEGEIAGHVRDILRAANSDPSVASLDVLNALAEILDRQQLTYVRGFSWTSTLRSNDGWFAPGR